MAIFVPRFLRQLRDVVLSSPADGEVLAYDDASGTWINSATAGGGVTDHGALTGLADNDHPQYQLASGAATDLELAAAIAGLSSVYQPLDSDVTALAALTTTAFGRGLLELANQAALLSAAGAAAASHVHAGEDVTSGTVADARIAATIARDSEVTAAISALSSVYQPLDSDLTSIAALTTTAFGRSVLALADQAALLAAAGAAPASHAHAGEDVTSGTVADARVASTITRDSEVASLAALVKLDDFAAPDDNTDLDSSTAKHGLLKKLPGGTTTFLRADGSFAAPAGGAVSTDAIFDAKGDLAVGTGADTAAKLTAGTNGYELVADSAQSTGLKWQNTSWTVVTKASDESVTSSTTLQNDDELFFTAVSGAAYEVEIVLVYASPIGAGTPDIKIALGEDSTLRGACITSQALSVTDAPSSASLITTQGNGGSSSVLWGTAAANRVGQLRGNHVGGGGTFRVQWAQNTSDVNAVTVRAGSVLRYRRIV